MSKFTLAVAAKRLEGQTPRLCKLGTIRSNMNDEDREALDFAIDCIKNEEGYFTQAWLSRTLRDNGYDLGKTVVRDHLTGGCICDTSQ